MSAPANRQGARNRAESGSKADEYPTEPAHRFKSAASAHSEVVKADLPKPLQLAKQFPSRLRQRQDSSGQWARNAFLNPARTGIRVGFEWCCNDMSGWLSSTAFVSRA